MLFGPLTVPGDRCFPAFHAKPPTQQLCFQL